MFREVVPGSSSIGSRSSKNFRYGFWEILGWGWRFMSSFRCGFWDGSEIALGWLRAGSRGSNVMVPEVPVWWFRSSGVVVSKLKTVQTRSNIKLKLK